MARQVLPWVGAAVGMYFGNPQLGVALGSLIGNAVDPLEVEGNKIGDNQMQVAAEGGARAIVYGRGCIRATCVLDRGNRQIRTQRDQAGKGGGPVTKNERVFWTFAIGLGEDLVGGAILRIWDGEKLVYDATPESTIPEETAAFAQKFRFYDGSETQLPDPALEAIHGIDNTPYYRGTSYVVFPNYDLTDYGESLPRFRWEVAKAAEVSFIGEWYALPSWINSADPNYRVLRTGSHDASDWSGDSIPYGGGDDYHRISAYEHEVLLTTATGLARFFDGQEWITSSYGDTGGAAGESRRIGDNWWICRGTNKPVVVGNGVSWSSPSTHNDACLLNITKHKSSLVGSRMLSGVGVSISGDGGNSWSAVTVDAGLTYPKVESNQLVIVFAATDDAQMRLFYSINDGAAFSEASSPFDPIEDGDAGVEICWADEIGVFVVADHKGQAAFSRTGMDDWQACTLPDGAIITGMDASDSIIAATCTDGRVIRSIDGETFVDATVPDAPETMGFRDIAYAPAGASHTAIGQPVPLSAVVGNIHARAGHLPSQYNVTELTDEIAGVVFEQSVTYGEAINVLIGPYFADPSDYDKCIHYLKRGKAVVRTLTEDDLVDEPETSMRENAIEYPRKLHLFFQSPATHYAVTKATSSRSSPDVKVIGESSVQLPITYNDPDEPAQISAKLHKTFWQDAEGEIVWHVTDEHIDLMPGDCVGLSYRGQVRRARITRIEDDPGVRKLTMRSDRQSAYTSNVTGIPLPPPTPPQPSIVAPTALAIIDESALVDTADDLHYLAAMSGTSDVWSGALLQRSLDSGANFGSVGSVGLNAIMGVLQDPVTAASPHYTDTTNVVRVQIYTDDEIHGRTAEQWLSEQGAFALSWEDSGGRRFEFLQARDVDDLGDGVFELSHLIRGALNTEAAAHAPGAVFVWLDGAMLKAAGLSAWMGRDLTHRAVSDGLSPEMAAQQTVTYAGRSQMEWPVGLVLLDHDGDDLHVEVIPRHRFGTDVNPIRSVNWTGYRIVATDGANSETVETTSPEHTFDVTGWASPIDVSVSQLNRLTGAGPVITEQAA